jgi:hypothetical protein
MRIIELDTQNWRTGLDFCRALLVALGAPEGHACNLNAIIDTVIWGGPTTVKPPFTIRILGANRLTKDSREEIERLKKYLDEARIEFRTRRGRDVEVNFEIVP